MGGLTVCSLGTSLIRLEEDILLDQGQRLQVVLTVDRKKRSQVSGFLLQGREPINELFTLRIRVPTYKFSREDRETVCSTNLHPHSIGLGRFQNLVALVLSISKRRGNSFNVLILNNISLLKKCSHMIMHVNEDLYINEYYIEVFIYVNKDFKFKTEWSIHI